MKKIFVIFLLSVILLQSSSSVMIMAIFYIQRDYIAKNICVNRFDSISVCKGQCYLNKQLKENEKKEHNLPELKLKEVELNIPGKIDFDFNIIFQLTHINKSAYKNSLFTFDLLHAIFHPPQFV